MTETRPPGHNPRDYFQEDTDKLKALLKKLPNNVVMSILDMYTETAQLMFNEEEKQATEEEVIESAFDACIDNTWDCRVNEGDVGLRDFIEQAEIAVRGSDDIGDKVRQVPRGYLMTEEYRDDGSVSWDYGVHFRMHCDDIDWPDNERAGRVWAKNVKHATQVIADRYGAKVEHITLLHIAQGD